MRGGGSVKCVGAGGQRGVSIDSSRGWLGGSGGWVVGVL